MNFINKAKASLKDLEKDLNKATAALGLNDKGEGAQSPSAAGPASPTASTPSGTPVDTPSTSVAPSAAPSAAAAAPKTKLPLAIRKAGTHL